MTQKQETECEKRGLFMAAVGSDNLWTKIAASGEDRTLERRLLDAMRKIEISPATFYDVRKMIAEIPQLPDVRGDGEECEPCPDPPCPDPDASYIRSVVSVLKEYCDRPASSAP